MAKQRPPDVVARDRQVATILQGGSRPLVNIMYELQLDRNRAYGSLWRLKNRKIVQAVHVGSRTPVWELTAEGHNWLQTPDPEPPLPTGMESPAPPPAAEQAPPVEQPPVEQPPQPPVNPDFQPI